MKGLILYTDGGARGNPGPAGVGVVITDETGVVLKTASKFLGVATNNEAEYRAAILGFELLRELFPVEVLQSMTIEHKLDSELVCKQLRGEYKIKEPRLKALYNELVTIISRTFKQVIFTHIKREYNHKADALANEAMDVAEKK